MDMLNEFNDSFNRFLLDKATVCKKPISGTIELTPICNMKCNMCYIQQEGSKVHCHGGLKDLEFFNRVVDEAINEGMLFCLLTGGEIFTYPHFKELYTMLKQKGLHIVLNTNGTMLNEENVRFLAANPPRRLNISLYGSSEETYEKLCHYKDGFNKVIKAFDLLNEYQIPFRVHGVLVPSNIHEFEGIQEICNRVHAPLQLSYYMFPSLRKEEETVQAKERFNPEEMAKVALKYKYDSYKDNWKEYLERTLHAISHPEQNPHYGNDKITCRAGASTFWLNWKGNVNGCSIGSNDGYDLEKISFRDAWQNIVGDVENTKISKDCAYCRYRCVCPTCHAGAICETGKSDGTPEYLCQFSKEFMKLLEVEYERIQNNENNLL